MHTVIIQASNPKPEPKPKWSIFLYYFSPSFYLAQRPISKLKELGYTSEFHCNTQYKFAACIINTTSQRLSYTRFKNSSLLSSVNQQDTGLFPTALVLPVVLSKFWVTALKLPNYIKDTESASCRRYFFFVGMKCFFPLTRAKVKYSWDLAEYRLKQSKLDLLY